MSLQFDKVTSQIQQMGVALADRSNTVTEQTEIAGHQLMELNDLDAVWDKIMVARVKDAGFRGAAPMDEPINQAIPLEMTPEQATILACDGSQIYPDPHTAAIYWLTNIGIFIMQHGKDELPECITEPRLFYADKDVRDREGRIIATAAINAHRAVYEMQQLAHETLARREWSRPLVAMYDGPLLGFIMGKDVPNANELTNNYHEALDILRNVGAGLLGYVDRPKSTFVVNTIYLMTLEDDQITRTSLQTAGPLEGLADRDLYQWILGPGDRCGMMTQQSPQNKMYKERSPDQEIVFFYMNVSGKFQDTYLARVEIPMWVAREKALVSALQALVYAQCQITDRYPYALTRADEIAVVHTHEKRALDEMIGIELLRNQQHLEMSQKLSSKTLARQGHSQHQGV